MPWIRQISEQDADGKLAEIYQAAKKRAGYVANILKLQGLNATILQASIDLYIAIMHAPAALSRARREMLATVVSRANGCYY